MEKLFIDVGEAYLVVEKYENVENESEEFVMYFQDKKTDCITQDIATIRQASKDGNLISGAVECLLWADDSDENYTHSYIINQFLEVV